ncbi:septum formation protein Maf [Bacillus sp. FJAT-27916]|uniref:Maf family protein n=1 Tax=Bacillaceae TaxID=186817 RepID=UPI0006707B7A|nr:Maf family protein [Bacillus sp. FJAT-27916]KMY43620.1 septum formation protein Maf [Bacillus sp. FJAT-27916]
MNLILASSSPRRKELLELLGIPFQVKASDVEETYQDGLQPHEIVMELARIKSNAIAETTKNSIVIGADTIVVSDGRVLGKPKGKADAISMLTQLSGKVHQVYTGVALVKEGRTHLFYEKTDVEFWPLDTQDIEQYVLTGEPFDKAGSYGIQGYGSLLVKRIEGDYFTVVGLPVSRLNRELKDIMHT